MNMRVTATALAFAAIVMGGCERGPAGPARVTWDDPAGDVKPYSDLPDQPRPDVVQVEASGSNGSLRLRVRLKDGLDRYFGYTRPDGKKTGGVAAQFFIDSDNNAETGGIPMHAGEAERPLRGYEYELSVRLGYRYNQGGARTYAYGDVFVDASKVTDLQPGVIFGVAKLRQGSDSYDFESLRLPADSDEVAQKASTWKADTIEIAVPYQWLGLKAGTTIRLCFKETAQAPLSGQGFSEDKLLRLE